MDQIFINIFIVGWMALFITFITGIILGEVKGRGVPLKKIKEGVIYTMVNNFSTKSDTILCAKMSTSGKKSRYYEINMVYFVDFSYKKIDSSEIPKKFSAKIVKVTMPQYLQNESGVLRTRKVWMLRSIKQ
ncbi:MAG: hypothetical protein KAS02_01635 [Candidatus Pacebacteria bacterium]|nr:hypothetical protein [Candidatus Paceibacterota bacterium]